MKKRSVVELRIRILLSFFSRRFFVSYKLLLLFLFFLLPSELIIVNYAIDPLE